MPAGLELRSTFWSACNSHALLWSSLWSPWPLRELWFVSTHCLCRFRDMQSWNHELTRYIVSSTQAGPEEVWDNTLWLQLRKMEYMLQTLGLSCWLGKDCQIKVSYIDSVRDWKTWFFWQQCRIMGFTNTPGNSIHKINLKVENPTFDSVCQKFGAQVWKRPSGFLWRAEGWQLWASFILGFAATLPLG